MFPEKIRYSRQEPREGDYEDFIMDRLSHENVDGHYLYEHIFSQSGAEEVFSEYPLDPITTLEGAYEFIDWAEESWENRTVALYTIRCDGEFAGYAGLHCMWELQRAGIPIWLERSFWGFGVLMPPMLAQVKLAFEHLDLDLIVGTCPEGNKRMKEVMDFIVDGYVGKYVGLLRNENLVNGKPINVHRFSWTREEYAKIKQQDDELRDVLGRIDFTQTN